MGFYFDEFECDKKQHLNLSETAWLTIAQDIQHFYSDEKAESKSGFLNIILKNFYEEADASINLRCINKREELEEIFATKEFRLPAGAKDKFIDGYVNYYKKKLVSKANAHSKGHGEKFRINVGNVQLLREEVDEEDVYEYSIGLYLKALYEEYCEKASFEREQIFFKDTIEQIQYAIANGKKLKIVIKAPIVNDQSKDANAQVETKKYYVSPYKIVQDETRSFNYLIGIAEEVDDESGDKDKRIASFRISRILRASVMKSMGAFISKENKDRIEKDLVQKTVQYMVGDLTSIKLRFTPQGIKEFKKHLYMRPQFYVQDAEDKLVYHVQCSERQALNYFFKFGKNVEILEPASLRERFIRRYESALEKYKQ